MAQAFRVDAAVDAAGQRDQRAIASFHLERARRFRLAAVGRASGPGALLALRLPPAGTPGGGSAAPRRFVPSRFMPELGDNLYIATMSADGTTFVLVDFDEPDVLFCRRQTGGLRCAITLAGGAEPSTRHVRCVLEGDAFCEWELRWN